MFLCIFRKKYWDENIDVINTGTNDQIGKMYKHSIGHLGNWFKDPIQDEKLWRDMDQNN